MNKKRPCDLSDIESLYFLNKLTTDMQETSKPNCEDGDKSSNSQIEKDLESLRYPEWLVKIGFSKQKTSKPRPKDTESHKVSPKQGSEWSHYVSVSVDEDTLDHDYQRFKAILKFMANGGSVICPPTMTPPLEKFDYELKECFNWDKCQQSKKVCPYCKPVSVNKPESLKTSKLENSYYEVIAECAKEFQAKYKLYGDSVFKMRESSLLDLISARAKRMVTLSVDGLDNKGNVGESITEDIRAIINYTLIILVLLSGSEDKVREYSNMLDKCIRLAEQKDADYNSAWKKFKPETLIDLIFTKVYRLQNLITSKPKGYEDNYFDLINYSIFALVKLK